MNYQELDTPSLIIDKTIMMKNLHYMQDYADRQGVALRPHTKTHKTPAIAKIQRDLGCKGITVAKVGEAEVMAAEGLNDIFVANEVVGIQKLERIRSLTRNGIKMSFGIDTPCQVEDIQKVFAGEEKPVDVLIEIEVGENRSGIIHEEDFITLLDTIKKCPAVHLKGVFSHEGHCYDVPSVEACHEAFLVSVKRTLSFADIARREGFAIETVSVGSTPSLMQGFDIPKGVTELRPGTYVYMDASMANTVGGDLGKCAATVLTTVISKPTDERVITDVGAKGMTMQTRTTGISACDGLGTVKGMEDVHPFAMFDEHCIFYNKKLHDSVKVGDKIEIYPVHICPVCNLYDTAYLCENGEIVEELPILGRGKLR